MNIYILALFCFSFSSILLGFMIFLKRRDSLGRHYFLYCIFCGIWAIGYSFQINNHIEYDLALWTSRFADAVALFIPPGWLMFISEFLNFKKGKKLAVLVYWISCLLLLTAPTELFIHSLKDKTHIGFKHFINPGPAFDIFTILFTMVTLYAFYLIAKAYFEPNLIETRKKQIKLFFIAAVLGYAGGSPAFLPAYDIDFPIKYCALIMPFYPFLMAFAITRYRFLDVDEIAKAAHKDKLAAIGTLATSLNHEVKNPLYIIRSLAETYLEKRKDGFYQNDEQALQKSGEILTKTVAQANRAMEIMKRFTLFAKQSINEKAQLELIYIGNILDDVIPLIHHELELDKIRLIRNVPADLSPIKADRRHMEEIFFNLVVNSCQAIKNESRAGEIKISAEQRNGHVKVVIEDDGPGIPPSNLKQIFEPFFTTKGKEGTGLGLYITKQLIERNEGKIHVKSEVSKGTSFVLEFKR